MHPDKILCAVVGLCLVMGQCVATLGGDVSKPVTAKQMQCLHDKAHWEFIIVRSYRSFGAIDTSAPETLAMAKAANISRRDVYHFPCMGKVSAADQIAASHAPVKGLYGTMWVDVEVNPSKGCEWSNDDTRNCLFVKQLLDEGRKLNIKMGIYGSHRTWGILFHGNCSVGTPPLWYARYDNVKSFAEWQPYGDWKSPSIKQYNDKVAECDDVAADVNWHP